MPKMGDGMEEGTLLRWIKKEGDSVAVNDEIAEIETDKANVPVPAEDAGTLTRIVVQEGQTVPVGAVIAYIGAIGVASVAKLVHNCAGYALQTALAEVFTMGVKGGVDPLVLWRVVRQGFVGRARVFDRLGDQFLPAVFDPPSFTLRLAPRFDTQSP